MFFREVYMATVYTLSQDMKQKDTDQPHGGHHENHDFTEMNFIMKYRKLNCLKTNYMQRKLPLKQTKLWNNYSNLTGRLQSIYCSYRKFVHVWFMYKL